MARDTGSEEFEDILKEQLGVDGEECQRCDSTNNVEIVNTATDGAVSPDNFAFLCPDCRMGLDTELTATRILSAFEAESLPFTTSRMIADDFDVSIPKARGLLEDLVSDGELSSYDLDERRKLYFKPDFRDGEEFLSAIRETVDLDELDNDSLKDWARQPYEILPVKGSDTQEYYVVAPRFLPFSLGHLFQESQGYRTFIVNKHASWFDNVPPEIEERIRFDKEYESAVIDEQHLKFASREEREQAWEDFGGEDGPFVQRDGDDRIRVQQGKEFEVIAKLIDGGNLPFRQQPVNSADLRPEPEGVSLREYQEAAWERFLEYGQIGVYWPPGAGKTYIALYIGQRIKGEKLVIVPTRLLQSQWEERIEKLEAFSDEWTVRTYQYLTHGNNMDEYIGKGGPALTIFDESHITPADTFSQLATIDTDYRVGLSASPFREDGREEYIFALTGVPVGVDWQSLAQYGIVDYPEINVYLYTTDRQRRNDLQTIVENKTDKGLIFCDSVSLGEQLSDELDVPFVSGDTPVDERLEIVRNNQVVLVSRVGDEGLSLDSVDWTVEVDFLGSSRRQEIQRVGRLLHSDSTKNGEHIIMMTDKEAAKHGDRLRSLEEQGMEIQYTRRG